mmetsp:Transcript_78426/g.244284  ORF Transcript_78426/g.244284 Transcript_78426/m.244284 type:complete len:235 (+) Transcript_78426:60-764(+)
MQREANSGVQRGANPGVQPCAGSRGRLLPGDLHTRAQEVGNLDEGTTDVQHKPAIVALPLDEAEEAPLAALVVYAVVVEYARLDPEAAELVRLLRLRERQRHGHRRLVVPAAQEDVALLREGLRPPLEELPAEEAEPRDLEAAPHDSHAAVLLVREGTLAAARRVRAQVPVLEVGVAEGSPKDPGAHPADPLRQSVVRHAGEGIEYVREVPVNQQLDRVEVPGLGAEGIRVHLE